MIKVHEARSNSEGQPEFLRHFAVANSEVRAKLEVYSTTPPHRRKFWTDFDHTLTKHHSSVWRVLRHVLPEPLGTESDEERKRNIAMEKAGQLTPAASTAWTKREIQRHVEGRVSLQKMSSAIKTGMKLRPGVKELFAYCARSDIERHILSASIGNAIELVGLCATEIHSNWLDIGEEGTVTGWDASRMVHTWNKPEWAEKARAEMGGGHYDDWMIILGDNLHDAAIFPHANAIRIRVCEGYHNTYAYLDESFHGSLEPHYDMVLRHSSLLPVIELLRYSVTSEYTRSDAGS